MSSAEDALRLAWQADRDGRTKLRDALLTLALADSGPDDAVSAERCRRFLVAGRPNHWIASFSTLGQALAHPRVAAEIAFLRAIFPPIRIQRLLLRSDAHRGPYTARRRSVARILDDLIGPRPQAPTESATRRQSPSALPFPGGHAPAPGKHERGDDPDDLFVFYLSVLMAIAILLASVQPPAAQDTRAA